MRRSALLLALVFALPVAALAVAARPAGAISSSQYCADAEEYAFLKLINDYRASKGLVALTLGQNIGAAAEHHAIDMATKNFFSHTGSDGSTPTKRMSAHGYSYGSWAAETIAAGRATAQEVFNGWKNSSGHNAIMLDSRARTIGVGRHYNANSTYKWYWTADYGAAADAAVVRCA